MNINDECGILKKIISLARKNNNTEHGAIAIGKVIKKNNEYSLIDGCMIEEIGGIQNEKKVQIPKKVSYALLNICEQCEGIPVVIHTHVKIYEKENNVSFSPPDMEFIRKFSFCASQRNKIKECFFIVTNGESCMYCLCDTKTMKYIVEEEVLNSD